MAAKTFIKLTIHFVVDKMMSKDTKANLGPVQNKLITLGCGVVAGAAAAVLSHPADTLLSQINKGKGGEGGAREMCMSETFTLSSSN